MSDADEKSQPKSKKIMLEMKLTKYLALSVDPRVKISQSASMTNGVCWKNNNTFFTLKLHEILCIFARPFFNLYISFLVNVKYFALQIQRNLK